MRWQYWTRWLLITGLWLAATPRSGNAQTALPQERVISEAVARRLHQDAQAVLQLSTNGMVSTTIQKEVAGELKRIEEEIPRLPQTYPENFRAILPINPLHKRIFEAQAAVWRASGARGIVAWASGAWDPLPLIVALPSKPEAMISAVMMNNEFRAGTFTLSNAGENDENVNLKISGLPGGENPSWIEVHEVAWTDTKSGQPIAAALPQAERDRETRNANPHVVARGEMARSTRFSRSVVRQCSAALMSFPFPNSA